MNIHQRFGANLRSLCYRYSSISEVCRGIGINRQQFNKYMAGQSMPNATTLRRICHFLKVEEDVLFSTGEILSRAAALQEAPSPDSNADQCFGDILKSLQGISNGNLTSALGAIQPGFYYCYFPLQNSDNFLIRSLIRVKDSAGATCFTRLTIFPSHTGSNKYLARGKHVGIIVANSHEIYFLGHNKAPPHQLSFLTFDRMNIGKRELFSGLAITRTGTGQMSARTCLQYLGMSTDVRHALRCLGPLSIDSPALEPFVYASMTMDSMKFANQLTAIDFDEILSKTVSGGSESLSLATANLPAK